MFAIGDVISAAGMEARDPLVFYSTVRGVGRSNAGGIGVLGRRVVAHDARYTSIFPLLQGSRRYSRLITSCNLVGIRNRLRHLNRGIRVTL